MDDYVSKPVRSAELFRAVEECAGTGCAGPVADAVAEADPGKTFDEAHFRRSIGDLPLMKQLLEIFPEDTDAFLRDADAAIAGRDTSALYRAAHSLRGMIGNYSAPRASEAIRSTCDLAQDGKLEEAAVAYQQARGELGRLREELRKFRSGL
jgi:protein-histidine pros-kinase